MVSLGKKMYNIIYNMVKNASDSFAFALRMHKVYCQESSFAFVCCFFSLKVPVAIESPIISECA